jgi:hypothetical protein
MLGREETNAYQKRAFYGVTASADDSPTREEDRTGDSRAYENSIDIANFGKGCDSPEEVDGA